MKKIYFLFLSLLCTIGLTAQNNFSILLNEDKYETTAEYDGDPLRTSTPTRDLTYLLGLTYDGSDDYVSSLLGLPFDFLDSEDELEIVFDIGIYEQCSTATATSGEKSYRHYLVPELELGEDNEYEPVNLILTLSNGEKMWPMADLYYEDVDLFSLRVDLDVTYYSHYKKEYGDRTLYAFNQLCCHDIVNMNVEGVDFPIDPSQFSTAKIMKALVARLNKHFGYGEYEYFPDERDLDVWFTEVGHAPFFDVEVGKNNNNKDREYTYYAQSQKAFVFGGDIKDALHCSMSLFEYSIPDNRMIYYIQFDLGMLEAIKETVLDTLKKKLDLENEGDFYDDYADVELILANGESFRVRGDVGLRDYDDFSVSFLHGNFYDNDRYKEAYGKKMKYQFNQLCRHDIVKIIIEGVEFPIDPTLYSTSQVMREMIRRVNERYGYGAFDAIPDERNLDKWDADSSVKSQSSSSAAFVPQASKSEQPVKSIVLPATATIKNISMEHNVMVNGERGLNVLCSFDVAMLGGDGICAVYLYNADGTPLKDTNQRYYTTAGNVANHTKFASQGFSGSYDLKVFFPYSELHIDMDTHTPLKAYFNVLNAANNEVLATSDWYDFYCAQGSSVPDTHMTAEQADALDKQSVSAKTLVMHPFGLLSSDLKSLTIDNVKRELSAHSELTPYFREEYVSLSRFSGFQYRVNNLNLDNASLYISDNYVSYGYDTRIKKSEITLDEMFMHVLGIVASLESDGIVLKDDIGFNEKLRVELDRKRFKDPNNKMRAMGDLYRYAGEFEGRKITLRIYEGAVTEVGDGLGIELNVTYSY